MLVAALSVLFSVIPAHSKPFSLDALDAILKARAPKTLEAALPLLPEEFRRGAVLMRKSRSLQSSNPAEPRALLSNEDGSFILAFNGDAAEQGGAKFEMIQFHREARRFEFSEVEFFGDRAPELRREVQGCSGCHGDPSDPHPIWDSFPKWVGAYGENGEQAVGTEKTELRDFLASAPKHPRYRALVGLGEAYGKGDDQGRFAGRPNAQFLRKLMRLNFARIADRAAASKDYAKYRYSTLASLYCMKSPTFAADFYPGVADLPRELLGIEESGADADSPRDAGIAFYWGFLRRGVSTFYWNLPFGDMMNTDPARLPPDFGSATAELARALAERDPELAPYLSTAGTTADCAELLRNARESLVF